MADYETERRSTYGNPYLKVFLRNNDKLEIIQKLLNDLQSIRKVNITENKRVDLTIYPAKLYEIEETEEEVISQLDSFFEERPLDPCFKDEQLSDISDEGYAQIISK